MKVRADTWLLVGLGVALAAAGVLPAVDAIVPWVFGIVDSVAWGDVWRPIYNPEPMDTYAYRPLSVVILKLVRLVFGAEVQVMTALHGLVLVAFGVSARSVLRRAGFTDRVAAAAAVSAMIMPSLLFSAWIVVEFDLIGAVFVLRAILHVPRPGEPPVTGAGRWFWFWAALAMTTKETSALQLLAWLAADAAFRRFDRDSVRRMSIYFGLLLIATAPMHFVHSANESAFAVGSESFHPARVLAIILHTTCQIAFLLAPAGAVVLWTAGLHGMMGARRPALGPWIGVALGVGLFAASPVLRTYSHFEAIVFSSRSMSVGLAVAVAAGLLALAAASVRGQGGGPWAVVRSPWALAVVFTWLGYGMAPVLLKFARADVSARIFAACVPWLHAIVWERLVTWWQADRVGKTAAMVLGVPTVGFFLAAGVNAVVFHRTRLLVEEEAKQRLAKDIRMACPALIATNAVQLSTVEELIARGARLGACAWIDTTTSQPGPGESLGDFVARGGVSIDRGQDAYLVVQTARSQMSEAANVVLAGDFSWTHDFLPEGDDDLFAAYQRLVYESETDIERVFRSEGHTVGRAELDYVQLPLFWTELFARVRGDVPLLETYRYVASVYRVNAVQPGYEPPGGRARLDHRGGSVR